ncbi:hypothetical protein BZG36_00706 [Bifiguratus adelaidae]|uniref:Phosphatidylserine decarboxylase proenzyme 1, mitochondrial n=1 Tax=Bifiguratus adelaidae TaxID=1938954 RepID=A0A261Y6V8_9FUNG|nr:hypothetical protein BZG36_00706 [Bifiguratus adelaidae]
MACRRLFQQQHQPSEGFDPKKKAYGERLQQAWNETEVKWYPIPVGVGLALLAFLQYQKVSRRERRRLEEQEAGGQEPRYVVKGPWSVQVAAALPLKTISRLWGRFNEMTIPTFLRVPGFRLYSLLFGVNLDEMKNPDLTSYPNLSSFFYRELKDGIRPIEPADVVSPADGRVLHFGIVEERRIEQIKGVSYSLDALIGEHTKRASVADVLTTHSAEVVDEEEFANVNGIAYSLDTLMGGDAGDDREVKTEGGEESKSVTPPPIHHSREGNALYFVVIYLAPGDYHRFHSPTHWIVESRRHFAGELFSVSPYMVKRLENLFVLNERVVLIGRWRYGFFAMIPVGATNVGSIRIKFDEVSLSNAVMLACAHPPQQALRTNIKEELKKNTFTQTNYIHASPILRGKPLRKGEEMGGFSLGSTVVLVFEAPKGFRFRVKVGQKIKMGQAVGEVVLEEIPAAA